MDDKKLKILLVDDDLELVLLYKEVFQNANYEVLQANDGIEGLDLATKEMPDIIFTGIVMPRMDGFSMIEALRKMVTTSNIPVVISSHMGREEDQKKANLLGVRDFIVRGSTTPVEVVRRIDLIFNKLGGEYQLEINQDSLDAQKLIKELGYREGFKCAGCQETVILKMKMINEKDRTFEAKFVCPKCGREAR